MPVLHLIDDDTLNHCPAVGAHLCDVLARERAACRVLVLGRGRGADRAGLADYDHVDAPTRCAPLTRRRVRRWARQAGPFDRIVNWSRRAARFARAASPTARQRHCDRIPVVIDEGRLQRDRRDVVREQLGAEPGDVLVWLMGDHPRQADAMPAIEVIGLAAEAGGRVRLVASPAARHLDQALRIVGALQHNDRLIVSDTADLPWVAAAACDAGISVAADAHADRLCIAWAEAANMPTVRAPRPDDRRDGAKRLLGI